ncbi:MAG: DUF2007 domain-containing protein [Candidatus Latescibacteria bacterium]|nr:DUF2007 domain-containing protein [Candidatus Latescibacterota bacterium]
MPFCPDCEYEYEGDITVCPDCGATLVEALTEQPQYICDECKEPLPGDAAWCSQCGTVFIDTLRCFRHPDTSAHGRCVICGQHLCKQCAVRNMGRYFCEQDANVEMVEGYVNVYTTGHDWEAELIKGYLENEGIPCRVFSQKDTSRMFTIGNLSVIKLLVPRSRFREAEMILAEKFVPSGAVQYECERCGAICGKDEMRCPNCGEEFEEERGQGSGVRGQ